MNDLLREYEARMRRVEHKQKPLTPQEERRETIAAMAIGALLGYIITEIIFVGCVP